MRTKTGSHMTPAQPRPADLVLRYMVLEQRNGECSAFAPNASKKALDKLTGVYQSRTPAVCSGERSQVCHSVLGPDQCR